MYTWAKSWEAEEKKEKKGERERRTVSEWVSVCVCVCEKGWVRERESKVSSER